MELQYELVRIIVPCLKLGRTCCSYYSSMFEMSTDNTEQTTLFFSYKSNFIRTKALILTRNLRTS